VEGDREGESETETKSETESETGKERVKQGQRVRQGRTECETESERRTECDRDRGQRVRQGRTVSETGKSTLITVESVSRPTNTLISIPSISPSLEQCLWILLCQCDLLLKSQSEDEEHKCSAKARLVKGFRHNITLVQLLPK